LFVAVVCAKPIPIGLLEDSFVITSYSIIQSVGTSKLLRTNAVLAFEVNPNS